MRYATIVFYLVAIIAANILTAVLAPVMFTALGELWIIPWGTFLIAATFFLRDAVQVSFGRRVAYQTIAVALIATIVISRFYDDLLWITIASAAAFAVSETLDTEIFTRLRARLSVRVAASGVVGGTIDSTIFAVLGLSPLTTGIVPWNALWTAIVAQVVVKSLVNLVAAGLVVLRPEPAPA